jgi:succinyl-CoA synthetase beta subunit
VTSFSEGGTSIEDLAEKYPDKIIKIPVDIRTGGGGIHTIILLNTVCRKPGCAYPSMWVSG